jgi:hypothetical protein
MPVRAMLSASGPAILPHFKHAAGRHCNLAVLETDFGFAKVSRSLAQQPEPDKRRFKLL